LLSGIIHLATDTKYHTAKWHSQREMMKPQHSIPHTQIHTEVRLELINYDDGTEEAEKILKYKYLLL
jgi:hypothetical protein